MLSLHGWAVVVARIVRTLGRARARGIALQVPFAFVVARAAVAVEEAVLLAGIHVVTGYAGCVRAFVVIERPRAFGIPSVDQTISVVVDAVRTLGIPGYAV